MPYNSRADEVRLLAERYETKSNVKLGGFRSKRPTCLATLKSCDTTKHIYISIVLKSVLDFLMIC